MNQRFTQLGLVSLAIVAGLPASAQTNTTGALAGTVTDAGTSKPIAGASIKLESVQGSRTVVTNDKGEFRLPLLNPGMYTVTISKDGYQTFKPLAVQVNLNETRSLNPKLAVVGGAVVEVVSAAGAAIDTTTSQTSTTYSMETIKAVPVGRTMDSITMLTPGVADNGMDNRNFSASMSGASGAENTFVMDGLTTTDSRYNGNGASLPTDFLDQMEVQTGGFKPEYSSLGGVVISVTKSGSNTTRGTAWATVDPRGLAAAPKISGTVAQQKRDSRYDVGFEVGGPLIQDRLFYWVGVNTQLQEKPEVRTNAAGLTGSPQTQRTNYFAGKLNWFITPDVQLTLFAFNSPYKLNVDRDVPTYGTANNGRSQDITQSGYNANLDWNITSNFFISAKLGISKVAEDILPKDPSTHVNDQRYFNDGPGQGTPGVAATESYETGGSNVSTNHNTGKNTQFRVDATTYLGNHEIKAGVSQINMVFNQDSFIGARPSGRLITDNIGGEVERIRTTQLRTRQVAFFDAESKSKYQAIYAQDTWSITGGLKLAFGVRLENQALEDSNGVEYLKFGFNDCVQPRLGIIWDINQDGLSKLSFNYAKYHEVFPLRYGLRYRGGRYLYFRKVYNTSQFTYDTSTGAWSIPNISNYLSATDYAAGYNDPPVVEGTKPPERTEYTAGYERNFGKGWTASINVVYRDLRNPIEDMTPMELNGDIVDNGWNESWQAVLGNPRPGVMVWTTSPINNDPRHGPGKRIAWNSTFKEGYNTYKAATLGLKHQSERNFISLNYTWSRLYGTYEGVVSSSNQQVDTNGTASFDLWQLVGEGKLGTDRTHVAKLIGSHSFPLGKGDLSVGYSATYQSGTPLSQIVGNGGGTVAGNWTKYPAPTDYTGYDYIPVDYTWGQFGRGPATTVVDVRVGYDFKVGKFQITPSVDILNFFNSREATSLDNQFESGGDLNDDWAKPTGFQIGRSVRFGVKVRF